MEQRTEEMDLFTGQGEMSRLMRAQDWAATPLGPVARWPQSLKIVIRILLDSRYAMWLGWGPEFTFFYNDAYARMTLGAKHPWALGRSAREVWHEIWNDIGPRAESVVRTGRATWDERLLLFLRRHGFLEETYHTFSYSPVPDDAGGVGGMLCVVTEDTARAIGERRLRTLRELAARTTEEARSAEAACQTAVQTLAGNPHDLPFALLYLIDADARMARLTGATGLPLGSPAAPSGIDLATGQGPDAGWPLPKVLETGRTEVVTGIEGWLGPPPVGVYPELPHTAAVLPLRKSGQEQLAGFLVAGVSPRRPFDDDYRGFLDLLAGQIATAIANARAYEEERRRAEALAELDRAKTTFFSNVSHEFRTPLTLMLGPVEDILEETDGSLTAAQRERLEVAHRNALRLQKLVNTLLDFSRIEAGRVRASYEPVDLASLTADLASNFRSACEKAGLGLVVDCPPLPEPVYVDREMWEKIVLNLVSNAFKYTLAGRIEVRLRRQGARAVLSVQDTGTGIPAEQVPLLFERFHRIEGARGRTQEGTGIGLALVKELVHLHGGEVRVESELGQGSTFTVTLPLGHSHLPADRIGTASPLASTALGAAPFVEEALRWLPDALDQAPNARQPADSTTPPTPPLPVSPSPSLPVSPSPPGHPVTPSPCHPVTLSPRPRLLVADDNADMRQYIVRLLAERYQVEAVADGQAALEAARARPPELVLTDVMMPRLDGFGLLRALRADPRTASVPILMLSARAGEESRVEGMQAGADDYLVKPFSARELLARVSAHVQMAHLRREASESLRRSEERFQLFMSHSPATAYIKDGAGRYLYVNRLLEQHFNRPAAEWIGKTDFDLFPPAEAAQYRQNDLSVLTSRTTAQFVETATRAGGIHHYLSFKFPLQDRDGSWLLAGMAIDITEQRRAEERERRLVTEAATANAQFRAFFEQGALFAGIMDLDGTILEPNRLSLEACGFRRDEVVGKLFWECPWWNRSPELMERIKAASLRAAAGETFRAELPYFVADGSARMVDLIILPVKDESGRVMFLAPTGTDITERKRAEERLRLLWEAATVLLTTEDPDAMLRALFAKIAPHFGLDLYFNFLVDESGDYLRLASCAGIPEVEARALTRLDFGQAVCGMVALYRQPIVATRIQESEEPMVQLVRRYGVRAYACNPLLVEGRLLGTLSFASRRRDEFGSDELEYLRTISHYVTVAYERLRLVRQLRDQDRRKDEFLATLAHELRNPLAPIHNSLHILKMPQLDAATVQQTRDMMERQLHHLVRLVDDLLDVSRVMRGKIELRKEPVELATVVARAVETAQPLIEVHGHRLDIALPQESLLLDADPVRLAQVIGNLLTNAAKYTEPSGHIWLTAERQRAEAVLRVRDTGIGIAPDLLPRVFDLFVQADHATNRSQGGLGIGLTLVRSLVEMHHGTVEAHSAGPGRGSEFVVRLPLTVRKHEAPHEGRTNGQAVTAGAAGHRLLVVDDNRDAAESLALLLRLQGHEVRVAHDGPTALELLNGYRPDLVFLDLGMPGMDGYEVARRLRQQPQGRHLRLAALTGWGQQEDRRRTAAAGFDHHLVKPVAPEALEQLLTSLGSPPP